jgi:flagellar basal body-associated protein FliL
MKKWQLILGILILITLQAVTAYKVVDQIVAPKIAALHAVPADTTARAQAAIDTTAHLFSISVGLDTGIATTYEVALRWADAQSKQKIEQTAPQIETTLKKLLSQVREKDINDPTLKSRLTDAVNQLIAPMRIADLSIRQPM